MWSSTAYVRYFEDNARFPVVAAPLPRRVQASVPTGGTMFVLLRAAPDEEKLAAREFVRWMCDAEQTHGLVDAHGLPAGHAVLRSRGSPSKQWWYAPPPERPRRLHDQLTDAKLAWPWSPELFRIDRDIVEPRSRGRGPERARCARAHG